MAGIGRLIQTAVDDALDVAARLIDSARRERSTYKLAQPRVRGWILGKHEAAGAVDLSVVEVWRVALAVGRSDAARDMFEQTNDIFLAGQPPQSQRCFIYGIEPSQCGNPFVHAIATRLRVKGIPTTPWIGE